MDCFELARDIRSLDIRAAHYDLRQLGYEPVRIETAEGKARYAAEQRGFSERGQAWRARLLATGDRISLGVPRLPSSQHTDGLRAGTSCSPEVAAPSRADGYDGLVKDYVDRTTLFDPLAVR